MSANREMLILAIESSAARSAVALMEDARLLGEQRFARGAGGVGADTPAEATEALLKAAGRKPADVKLVAVSIGPGSYTGLRIGASFAKTFAWAVGAAVVAVPSLAALAGTAVAGCRLPVAGLNALVPTADAFRGQLYARAFRAEPSGELTPLTDDLILSPADLIAAIRSTDNRQPATGNCCFGSGAAKYAGALAAAAGAAGIKLSVEPEPSAPSAEVVGRWGLAAFLAGKTVTAHGLAPVYLRKTEAEERAEARAKKA